MQLQRMQCSGLHQCHLPLYRHHPVQRLRHQQLRFSNAPQCKSSGAGKSQKGFGNQAQRTPAAANPKPKSELDKCYLGEASFPKRFIGPIEVVQSSDKGRGLAVVEDVSAGQLLIASQPLGVVYTDAYEEDEDTDEGAVDNDMEQLQALMQGRQYTAYERAWIDALYDGTKESMQQPLDLKQLATLADSSEQQPLSQQAAERLSDIIDLNHFQDTSEDEAMAKLRNMPDSRRPLGVWPEPSLLNHSCAPNVVQYVFQDTMFVRASAPLKAGTELTSNYLSNLLFAPVGPRRAALQEDFGFQCQCPRCLAELKQSKGMQQILMDIYEATSERLSPDLAEALSTEDKKSVRNVRNQLLTYIELLDAALTKESVDPEIQVYLQASVFDVYMLLGFTLDFLDDLDINLYQLLQALMARVNPGSDSHIYWSGMLLDKLEELDEEDKKEQAADANELCQEAFMTRYGPISQALYRRMFKARITDTLG